MRSLRTSIALTMLLCVVATAACGGGDDGGAPATSVEAQIADAEAAPDTGPGALPEECPDALPYDVEIRLDGDGAREVMTVVDAIALRRVDGRAWTVYLADFELPDETSWAIAVPEVPTGKTLVATGLDTFNAADVDALPVLEVGDRGGLFREVGDGETATFFTVTADRVGSSSVDQVGSSELLHLDDEAVCLTVSITGVSGLELVGTYAAFEIVDI